METNKNNKTLKLIIKTMNFLICFHDSCIEFKIKKLKLIKQKFCKIKFKTLYAHSLF